VLISASRTAGGIRNLVGTGIIQLIGGLITAAIAFGILVALNWKLTLGTVALLLAFAASMAIAFKKLRPIFRKRGEITAEVTGRLTEAMGGVRLLKTYVAEPREQAVFGAGVDRLFRNIASTITGTSAVGASSIVIAGGIGVMVLLVAAAHPGRRDDPGELFSHALYVGVMTIPLVQISSISTRSGGVRGLTAS
jgi:subfamily B ATP-binding cassette protein MsbA